MENEALVLEVTSENSTIDTVCSHDLHLNSWKLYLFQENKIITLSNSTKLVNHTANI